MKCQEVRTWLYSFRPKASCPVELVGHLQECSHCQQLQTQLQRVDHEVQRLTGFAPSRGGKKQLLERLKHTPQQPNAKEITLKIPRTWVRGACWLAGAAALILFGWLLGHRADTPEKVKIAEAPPVEVKPVEKVVRTSVERDLFATLIKRNVQLVQATEAKDRLDALMDMADDCRQHALLVIEKGPHDHLPQVIDMYSKLLREGLLVQLQRTPADKRVALTKTVRSRLEEMAIVPDVEPDTLPKAIEDQLDALENIAEQVIALLENPEPSRALTPKKAAARQEYSDPVHPTTALVQFAITASNETDPVVKAEFCAECIHQLMPCVLLSLADDTNPLQSELGQQFGELIRLGIYTPLGVARAKDPSPQTVLKTERILERTSQAVEHMEQCFHKTPIPKRGGLEHALQASRKGIDRAFLERAIQEARKNYEKMKSSKKPSSNKNKRGKFPGFFKKTKSKQAAPDETNTKASEAPETSNVSREPSPLVLDRLAQRLDDRRNDVAIDHVLANLGLVLIPFHERLGLPGPVLPDREVHGDRRVRIMVRADLIGVRARLDIEPALQPA